MIGRPFLTNGNLNNILHFLILTMYRKILVTFYPLIMKTIFYLFALLFSCFNLSAGDGEVDQSFSFNISTVQKYRITSFNTIKCTRENKVIAIVSANDTTTNYNYYLLLCLLPDGSLDNTFTIQTVYRPLFDIQYGNKLIVGMVINQQYCITRLHSDGTIDESFKNLPYREELFSINVLKDHSIILSGKKEASSYQSTIIKLSPKGELLLKKTIYSESYDFDNLSIGISSNGNLFYSVTSLSRYYDNNNTIKIYYNTRVDELLPDLTLVDSAKIRIIENRILKNPSYQIKGTLKKFLTLNSKLLFYGSFAYNKISNENISDDVIGIFSFNSDGKCDTLFNKPRGTVRGFESGYPVDAITMDNNIILVGGFQWYNGVNVNGIVRIDEYGNIDDSFTTSKGTKGTINSITKGLANSLYIAGDFTSYNNEPRKYIARLKSSIPKSQYEWYNALTILPNPATDVCTVDNIPAGYTVNVSDILGNNLLVYPPASFTNVLTIDTGTLSTGIYFFHIKDTNGNIMSKMFTVEH